MAKRKRKPAAKANQPAETDQPFTPELESEPVEPAEAKPAAEPLEAATAAAEAAEPAEAKPAAEPLEAAAEKDPFPRENVVYGVTRSGAHVTLTLPLGPARPAGYLPRKVESRLDALSAQPLALRRLLDGFQAEHAQLATGKHVDSYAEAVRKLLELIAEAAGDPPPAEAAALGRAA